VIVKTHARESVLGLVSVLALALVLTACGGGGGGGGDGGGGGGGGSGTLISGTVLVGSGDVAGTGNVLLPLANAEVSLHAIDDAGVETSANALAETTADADGRYSLRLPDGEDPSPNYIVKVTIDQTTTPLEIRAQVVATHVDISPYTEYVLRLLTEGGFDLSLATSPQVAALWALLREADGGESLQQARAALILGDLDARAPIRGFLDPVRIATQLPAEDSSSLTGVWSQVHLALDLTAFTGRGTTSALVREGGWTLTPGSDGAARMTETQNVRLPEAFLDATDDGTGGVDYDFDYGVFQFGGSGSVVPMQLGSGLSLTTTIEGYEDFFAADQVVVERTGGWTAWGLPGAGNPGAFVLTSAALRTDYGITASNAVDYESIVGYRASNGFGLLLRRAQVLNTSLHLRTYGGVGLWLAAEATGIREVEAEVGTMTFNAIAGTVQGDGDDIQIRRVPSAGLIVWGTDADSDTAAYQIDQTTGMGILSSTTLESRFYIADGLRLLVMADHWPDATVTSPTGGGVGLSVGVELPSSVASNPNVAGRSYRAVYFGVGFGEDGTEETVRAPALELNVLATTGADNVEFLGFRSRVWRSLELAGRLESETVENDPQELVGTFAWGAGAGEFSVDFPSGLRFDGFFGRDGEVGVIRVSRNLLNGTDGSALLGMIVLARQ
jgi:hypothetical protein